MTPGPCDTGRAILIEMDNVLGVDANRPVDEIADPVQRAAAHDRAMRWREHFLSCTACTRVWLGMAVQAGSGRNVDWRSAALFVDAPEEVVPGVTVVRARNPDQEN